MSSSSIRGGLRLARWGSLALLALAGCGGSDGGDAALVGAALAAPCATAFDPPQPRLLSKMGLLNKTDDYVMLSECTLDDNRNVTIGSGGCGPIVVIDKSFTGPSALGKITIAADGNLAVTSNFDTLELETTGISVAGLLSIGTAQCPVGRNNPQSKITFTFTGKHVASGDASAIGSGSDKGIEVQAGGKLRMHGAKGVAPNGVNWTHLSAPAGPGQYTAASDKGIAAPVAENAFTLHLARDVTTGGAWRPGDWIVVATTSFSPFESEFVQIETVKPDGAGGSLVTLKQALRHYHFGGADPACLRRPTTARPRPPTSASTSAPRWASSAATSS